MKRWWTLEAGVEEGGGVTERERDVGEMQWLVVAKG
jgi:hypothetical protein